MSDQPSPRETIRERWRALREAGALGALLPKCVDRSWGEGESAAGFVTVDYRVYRDLALPAGPLRPTATRAELVEMYWAVRTKGGAQDSAWAAALNAHVIQVQEDPVTPEALEDLYQLVVSLRRALQVGAIGPLVAAGKPVALHARGLLLGPALSTPAELVERLAARADVPLAVGCYDVEPDGQLRFVASSSESRHWETSGQPDEQLAALGLRLVQHDQLYRAEGSWAPDPGYDWDDEGNPRPIRAKAERPRGRSRPSD